MRQVNYPTKAPGTVVWSHSLCMPEALRATAGSGRPPRVLSVHNDNEIARGKRKLHTGGRQSNNV